MRKLPIPVYTPEQESRFVLLMKSNKNFVYHLIRNKYVVHSRHDIDDYYQEVWKYAWLRYHRYYEAHNYTFTQWIKKTTEWAINTYLRASKSDRTRIRYVEDISFANSIVDDPYEEDHINSLRNAIASLDDADRIIVMKYLDTAGDVGTASDELSRTYSSLKYRLNRIRKHILNNRHIFFEDLQVSDRKLVVISNGKINEKSALSKPVDMLTMEGEYIKSFPSTMEAERQGFMSSCIKACCRGKCFSHAGYRWRYSGEQRQEVINRTKKRAGLLPREIHQLTMEGEIVKTWPSLIEAENNGFTATLICKVLKGKRPSHRGYKWAYAEQYSKKKTSEQ